LPKITFKLTISLIISCPKSKLTFVSFPFKYQNIIFE
jgi:hypothetical protein